MAGTLLLNATYEPLCVVSVLRAVVLVLDERAEIVEAGEGELRSPSVTVPVPRVIRLLHVVYLPKRRVGPATKRGVLGRDRRVCQYCGGRANTVDHVIPRSRGGAWDWGNLAAACGPCNQRKDDRTPEEAGMRLARTPRPPSGRWAVVVAVGELEESWVPYLSPATR